MEKVYFDLGSEQSPLRINAHKVGFNSGERYASLLSLRKKIVSQSGTGDMTFSFIELGNGTLPDSIEMLFLTP